MNVLVWHLHGSYLTGFVQGPHRYLVPVDARRGPYGLGRARTWNWPVSTQERTATQLRDEDIDVVVLQRPYEAQLAEEWTGRRPGRDVPAVYLEHDAPVGVAAASTHPLAGQHDIPIVHCTHFNQLMWDSGRARTYVVEHGIPDPGDRWTGELAAAAVVVNDAASRGRTVGTDLLGRVTDAGLDVDLFGMRSERLPPHPRLCTDDLPQRQLHDALARRRLYLHTARWTSLGLSLLEAMTLGMPVVALATTEAVEAVPPDAGAISTDLDRLIAAARTLMHDREAAAVCGKAARRAALERYGLGRFLADWDSVLAEVAA